MSLDYTKYYQRLVTIEKDGICCGFGPPTRCTVRVKSVVHRLGFFVRERVYEEFTVLTLILIT